MLQHAGNQMTEETTWKEFKEPQSDRTDLHSLVRMKQFKGSNGIPEDWSTRTVDRRMEGAKEPNIVSSLARETPNRIVATLSMQIHATLI